MNKIKYFYCEIIGGYPKCMDYAQDEEVKNYRIKYGANVYQYAGEALPARLIVRDGELQEPTQIELHQLDGEKYRLPSTHYIRGEEILEKPEQPKMLHPYFHEELEQWIELATDEELVNYDSSSIQEQINAQYKDLRIQEAVAKVKRTINPELQDKKNTLKFYDIENTNFRQLGSEYLHGSVTEEDYLEAKAYMEDLVAGNPVIRPLIFENKEE